MGGTMRLGADPVKLHPGTKAREIYGEAVIYERHRHRYEVNNFLRRRIEAAGPRRLGHDARRAARRGHRAARAPVLRGLAVPPGVQVAPRAPGAAVPRVRRRRPALRARAPAARAAGDGRADPVGRPEEERRPSPRAASSSADVRPASEAERARLNEHVRRALPHPEPVRARGGRRRARHARAGGAWGSRSRPTPRGNLLRARSAPARSERTVLLCAHLDTVAVDGRDRAGASSTAAGRTRTTRSSAPTTRPPSRCSSRSRGARASRARPVGIELLLTVEEENALAGAKAFDASVLRADFGYVFDHATPIGEVDRRLADLLPASAPSSTAAPRTPASARRPGAAPILAAAHAIAAMPHGRIDEETTANVGSIQGGVGSTNVVPERCRLLAEARSLDPERVEQVVAADDRRGPRRRRRRRVRRRRRRARSSSPATGRRPRRRRSSRRRPRCAPAATSRSASSPAAARTRTRSRCRGSSASTSPTAPSATTSRPSASASRRSRAMFDVCLALLDEAAALP